MKEERGTGLAKDAKKASASSVGDLDPLMVSRAVLQRSEAGISERLLCPEEYNELIAHVEQVRE